MSTTTASQKNDVLKKCAKGGARKGWMVIDRSELMDSILQRNIDKKMKRQLSSFYDMILDMECENKTYITKIKVENDSGKDVFNFLNGRN